MCKMEENLTDTILDFPIFKKECPISINIVGDTEQLILNDMIGNWCAFCEDNYKKCWKKYFEEIQLRKERQK